MPGKMNGKKGRMSKSMSMAKGKKGQEDDEWQEDARAR